MSDSDFILESITEQDYESAGSKFITFPEAQKQLKGAIQYREVTIGMLDWDTFGKSLKIPVVVSDDIDTNHEDKISFGVDKKSIWKGKLLYKNITGEEMPMVVGKDGNKHPAPSKMALLGKKGFGMWVNVEGKKGGDAAKGIVIYPKLEDILPYNDGQKPTAQSTNLGF